MSHNEAWKELVKSLPRHNTEAFMEYMQKNRHIWKMFERIALKAINGGMKRWSARAIIHIIRWESVKAASKPYKIPNVFSAYFARLFVIKHPQYVDFFTYHHSSKEIYEVAKRLSL